MEFRKKLFILSGLLVFFILTYTIGSIFSARSMMRRTLHEKIAPGLNIEDIGSVQINNDEGSIRLAQNTESQWGIRLEESVYPAESDKVKAMIEAAINLEKNRIVSRKKEYWERLEVDKDNATTVFFYNRQGNPVSVFFLGKLGEQPGHQYVRVEGDNTVYLTDAALSSYAQKGKSYWSYTGLFPEDVDADMVQRLEVDGDILVPAKNEEDEDERILAKYQLQKKTIQEENTTEWVAEGDESRSLDQNAIRRLVRNIVTTEGSDFVLNEDQAAASLESPDGTINLHTKDNRKFTVLVTGQGEESTFIIRLSEGEFIYTIGEWALKQMFQPISELTKKTENE